MQADLAEIEEGEELEPVTCLLCPSDEFAFVPRTGHLICWSCGFGFLPSQYAALKAASEKVN